MGERLKMAGFDLLPEQALALMLLTSLYTF
jgi:hypothetical protein